MRALPLLLLPLLLSLLSLLVLVPAVASAQIRVHPSGVNVNAHGATTVFLTFGGLGPDQVPVEAFWCGALLPAAPDRGTRCDPGTLFGQLPLRYDQARGGATGALTDVMSIPPSVARRAYQAAEAGAPSSFFYVRRFASRSGGPDEYVAVTCRLTGGGARVPLAHTDVRVAFEVESPVAFLPPGTRAPAVRATLTYNGTGRLQGRWEIVLPGEEPPEERDLLTEATLPPEERGTQRRWRQLERFNVFLPPTGRVVLPGPDPARLPTNVEGDYQLLLRIEASDDKEGDSDLRAVGAGTGVVHSGGVAGFPMPVLRYYVGAGGSQPSLPAARGELRLLGPADGAPLGGDGARTFRWTALPVTAVYRLEIRNAERELVHVALLRAGTVHYVAPPWLAERAGSGALGWRVRALDGTGASRAVTPWRALVPGDTPDGRVPPQR